jgi:plasmid stabilization system protein ParE
MSPDRFGLRFEPRAVDDLERVFAFYESIQERLGERATDRLIEGLKILAHSPFVGRRASDRLRELVIGWGASGFVALYHVDLDRSEVVILALRHQREADFDF